eukprot:gene25243-33769_t
MESNSSHRRSGSFLGALFKTILGSPSKTELENNSADSKSSDFVVGETEKENIHEVNKAGGERDLVYNGEKISSMKIFRVRSALRDCQIEFGRYDNLETLVELLTNHLLATASSLPENFHHDEEVKVANDDNSNNNDAQNDAINIASSSNATAALKTKKRSNSSGSDRPYSVVYSLRSRVVDTSPVLPRKKGKPVRKKTEKSQTSPIKKATVAAAVDKKKKGRPKTGTKSTATQVDNPLDDDLAIHAVPHASQASEANGIQQGAENVSHNIIAGSSHNSEEEKVAAENIESEYDVLGSNSPVVTYENLFADMRYSYGNEQQNLLHVANSNSNDERSEAPQEAAEGAFHPHQNFNEKSQEYEQQHIADEENSQIENDSYMDVQDPDQKEEEGEEEVYQPFSDAQSYQATLNESEEDNHPEINDMEEINSENEYTDAQGDDVDNEGEDKEETVASVVDQSRSLSPEDSTGQEVAVIQSAVEPETENLQSQVTLTQPVPPTVSTPVRNAIEAFQKLGTRFISVVVGEQTGEKLSIQEYDLLKSLLEKNKPSDVITSAPSSTSISAEEGALVVHSNTVALKEPDAIKSAVDIAIQVAEDEQAVVPFKEFSTLPPVPESAVKLVIPRRSMDSGTWDSRNSFLPSPSPSSYKAPAHPSMASAVTQKGSVTSLADILSRRNSLRDIFQSTDDGNSNTVTESRKRSFVEYHENGEDKYSDSILFSASKKATVETFHSAQPSHRQLGSSIGSGVINESKNRLQGSDSAFPHRSSYIPVFKSNTARFTGNETSNRQSIAGPQSQLSVSRAPLSLSYSERRKLQRQSEGRDGATTVSKKILETLSGINTPIENERNRPVAISWKDFGPPSKKPDGESARKPNLTSQEPVSHTKVDTKPIGHDISSEASHAPFSNPSKVEPKPTLPVFGKPEPTLLPKPVLPTSSQEEYPKKTVTFSAIDEEFIFEEPCDDLVASSNLTTTSSMGADGIQYLFSPPKNRISMKSTNLPKASSSLPLKEKVVPKNNVAVIKPPELSEKPPAVPAVNIWATVATDKVKCNVCMVPNSKGATKCVSCDSPLKAEVAAVPKVKSIWDVNTNDFIKCSACMVQNSKTAVKCASCESPLATTSAASTFPSTSKAVSAGEATKPASTSDFIFGVKPSVPENTAAISAPSSQPFASVPMPSETISKGSTGFVFGIPAASTVSKTGSDSSLSDSKAFQPPPASTATAAVPSKQTFDFPKSSMSSNAASTTFGGVAAGAFGSIGSGTSTTFGVDASKPLSQIPQFSGFTASTKSAWNAPSDKAVSNPTAKPNEDIAPFSQPALKSNPFGKSEETLKPPISNVGVARPFSNDDDSGDQQDTKRKSNRQNESEPTSSTAVAGASFFVPSASGKQDDKGSKAPFTFGSVSSGGGTASSVLSGPFSSTATPSGPFSSTAAPTGPFSISFPSANAFPAIPTPAAATETKPKLLNFGTSSSTAAAPSSSTNIEPKLNFGSTPALTGSQSHLNTSTSTLPSFGVSTTTTSTTGASAQPLVKAPQPFGTGSSTSFGSQPSFGSAPSFSTIAPSSSSSTTATEPTFGSGAVSGIFNSSSKSVPPMTSTFTSSALGTSSNAFATAFSSTPTSSAPSFAPSVPSASAPFGQSANKPEGSGMFGFGSTTTTAAAPFSANTSSNNGFGFVGNESPSMDMAGDSSNLSAPVANSNTSNNHSAFSFGGNTSSTGIGSGSAFGNPFHAVLAQTQPAPANSQLQPFAFGGSTTNSFGGNTNSSSNVFGGSFSSSNNNQPQLQPQSQPFGGSGSMFGAPQPAAGAFGGFASGAGTGMGDGTAATPAFGGGGGAGGGFSMGSADPKKSTSSSNLAGRKILKAKRPAH